MRRLMAVPSLLVAIALVACGTEGAIEPTETTDEVVLVRVSVARPMQVSDIAHLSQLAVVGTVTDGPTIRPFRNEEFGQSLDLPYLNAHFDYPFRVERTLFGDLEVGSLVLRWLAPNPELASGLPPDTQVVFEHEEFMEPRLEVGERYVLFLSPVQGSKDTYWVTFQNFGSVLQLDETGVVSSVRDGLQGFVGLTPDEVADLIEHRNQEE